MSIQHLSPAELISHLKAYLQDERQAMVLFLGYLEEAARRKIYLSEAKPSLFAWLTETFGMSEAMACRRIAVVKLWQRLPSLRENVLQLLSSGDIHLAGLGMLIPYMTIDNGDVLLQAICGKSKRDIEAYILREFPSAQKPKPDYAKPIIVIADRTVSGETVNERPAGATATTDKTTNEADLFVEKIDQDTPSTGNPDDISRTIELVTIGVELRTTLDAKAAADLDYLQKLMPGMGIKGIIAEALRHYRRKKDPTTSPPQSRKAKEACQPTVTDKKPSAAVDRSAARTDAAKTSSSLDRQSATKTAFGSARAYIPIALRRAVYLRDQGRCQFRSPDGKQCSATTHLELDHHHPLAKGGDNTIGNLRLLCRAHNQYCADLVYGKQFMAERRKRADATFTFTGEGDEGQS